MCEQTSWFRRSPRLVRKTVQLCLKLNGSVIKLHAITNLPSWRNKYKQVRGRNELLYSWKLFFDYLEQSLSNQLSKAEKETTTIIIDACLARPKRKKSSKIIVSIISHWILTQPVYDPFGSRIMHKLTSSPPLSIPYLPKSTLISSTALHPCLR